MVNGPDPNTEAKRLRALKSLNILDTPSEDRFDRVTRLAKRLFDVPIVLMTLIDADRLWIKSGLGLELSVVPRSSSICTHTIQEDSILIIPDLLQDPRFLNHTFAFDTPQIRFYAGCPLTLSDDNKVGTLCIIDHQPRTLDEAEAALLQDLANIIQTELNLTELSQFQQSSVTVSGEFEANLPVPDRTIETLRLKHALFEAQYEASQDGTILISNQGDLLYANQRFTEMSKLPKDVWQSQSGDLIWKAVSDYVRKPTRFLARIDQIYQDKVGTYSDEVTFKDGRIFHRYTVPVQDKPDQIYGRAWFFQNITAQKQTELKLNQQQAFLRQVIDLIPHLLFARNRNGVFTLANQPFADIYGVSSAELCGMDDTDFDLDPNLIKAYRQDDLEIMKTRQESINPEQIITTAEGENRWWNVTKRPIVDEDGTVNQILGIVTDITERKQAEIKLQKSEEQFRLVFELAPIGMAVVGFNGRFSSINQAFCQTLGYTASEMLKKTIAEITHPDDLETALDQRLIQGTIPHFQTERRYIHKSGQEISAILQVTLVRNTDGHPQHFIVQVVDITERTQAEVAIKQQEAFLKQVIDTVPHPIYVKNGTGHFTLINQALADLYDTTVETIIGKRDVDFDIVDDAMMRFYDQDKPVLETGEELFIPEEVIIDPRGQQHWLQTTKRPIIEPDGSIRQVVSIAIDITEQKWAEEAIRASQQKLALHFQNTPVGVIEWSPNFEVVDWNPAAERIFGYTRQEVLQKRGTFIMQTGTQEFFDSIWGNLLKKNRGTSGIQQNIRKDRKKITCQWYNTPLRDEAGHIIGVASLIEDITERIEANEALQESEARLVKMTENAPGLIFQFVLGPDQSSYFSYASAWVKNMLGLDPSELNEDAVAGISVIHPNDKRNFLTTMMESARLMRHWHWIGRMLSKGGKVIHVQGDAKPELMENGDTVWNGVIMDITERVLAEEERDRLFNLSVDMMAIGGVDGYFKRINPAFETMLGYASKELIENPIVEFVHPEDIESIVKQIKAFAAAKPSETFHFENRFRCHDGSYKWLDWTAVSAKYSFYTVARDITARKMAEEELIISRDRAIEVSRLKSELLAKVSHELRTPLGAILGFAEMIKEGIYGDITADQYEATAKIIDSTTYLSSMVNELLDQAQLEAKQLSLTIKEFDPRDVVNTVQSRMHILAKNKGIALITQVASNLSSCVYGDETRVQQILINLVSNAIKFTEIGTVKVYCYQSDPFHWAFQVSDTGIGIPKEAQERIFEPFGQVDGSATREQMGTGLGLSIVQQLTNLMAGKISLKSSVGRGSTFTIILPVQFKQPKRSDVHD